MSIPTFVNGVSNVCTVSWWREKQSYGLLFNRDESRRRPHGRPPELFKSSNVSYLAPVDPEGGGTWVWANQHGLVCCILNHYPRHDHRPETLVSRGLLLKSLAACTSAQQVLDSVSGRGLSEYRAFYILALEAAAALLLVWDGKGLTVQKNEGLFPPITTSGFRPEEVTLYRQRTYREMIACPEKPARQELERYHSRHDPDFPACSVIMSRPETRTVSQSRVTVGPDSVILSYAEVSDNLQLMPVSRICLDRV